MLFSGQQDPLNSAQGLWGAALGALEVQMSATSFHTWLKDTQGVAFDGRVLEIATPNIFAREWLEQRLHSLVCDTLSAVLGRQVGVRFIFSGEPQPLHPHHRYSFDLLVTGDFNRQACTSAQEVLASPGQRYNPLVLWGSTGVGKTHLLQAIAGQASQRGWRALYLTGEQFTNQFISALRQHHPQSFRETFQSLDLCLLDDIQFLQGKGQTQQAFFHIFNDLYEADCQLVLSSSETPRNLNGVEDRLRSRLLSGLLVKVDPPGEKDRQALLKAMGERVNLSLPPEVLSFVAHRAPGNVRELEGIVNRLISLAKANGGSITGELATQALSQAAPPPPSPAQIVSSVLAHFHLPSDAFLSRRRHPLLTQARGIAIYLLREQGYSLGQIGEAVGGLAKSSVLTSFRKAQQDLKKNSTLEPLISEILNRNSALI